MLITEIRKIQLEKNRSILIGIDGLGGSGKTSYAREFHRKLTGSILFHLDDFIHIEKTRYDTDFEEWYCYYHLQWRYDYLIQKLLKPIQNGLFVDQEIELYDKENDTYLLKQIEVPVGGAVLVEGVFLQRPELRQYFDYVIYLDVDKETRLGRVLGRDTYIGDKAEITSKYERRYFPGEQKYIEECNPIALADLTIN